MANEASPKRAVELTDSEKHFLRNCPQRLFLLNRSRPTPYELAKLKMIQRLTERGLVHGRLDSAASTQETRVLDIALTMDGRRAIGLPVYTDAGVAHGDQHA